jgi:hypothetical protein
MIAGIIAVVITVALWCCCKVAGDADERDDRNV